MNWLLIGLVFVGFAALAIGIIVVLGWGVKL